LIDAGLIAARFLHLAAAMALFGLALFPLYSYPRGHRPAASASRWLRTSLRGAAWLALLSGLAWVGLSVVSMAGSVRAAADPDALSVLIETSFGQVWIVRFVLVVALLVLVTRHSDAERHPRWTIVLLTGLLLLSVAFAGHTQTNDGLLRIVHVTADGVHLLAAGTWLGGLLALSHLLMAACRFPSPERTANAAAALVGFSGVGYIVVAALVGSGLINAWVLVGSVAKLAATPYGQLLLVKLCLFAAMLALAALNRFRLVPSLARANERGEATARLRRLRQSVIGEQALGLAVVLIVGYLGTMQPAIALSE
jgi:copper resistance protein D